MSSKSIDILVFTLGRLCLVALIGIMAAKFGELLTGPPQ